MAIRTILEFPDQRLRTRATPVTRFDAELSRLIDDMFESMYAAPGIGLAATQVDVHKRLIVIDLSESRNEPLVLINPQITPLSDETEEGWEGCLSVPGMRGWVPRWHRLRYSEFDEKGISFEREVTAVTLNTNRKTICR